MQIYPTKYNKQRNEYLFCAPYRDEKDGSLWVNAVKNVWKDFGTGYGGNIIDLTILMHNCDVHRALQIIEGANVDKIHFSSFRQQSDFQSFIDIKHMQPLQNRALIEYLTDRKINIDIARIHLQEAYYVINEKKYFALAFRNDKGGYELRNKYFKGSNSPKWISTIEGSQTSLNVFEGFMDYLSCLTHYRAEKLKNKTIVLNSLAFINLIKPNKNIELNLFLDNDNAGNEATYYLSQGISAFDFRKQIYPNHKDFNEFLMS